jgi:hypothetical protein
LCELRVDLRAVLLRAASNATSLQKDIAALANIDSMAATTALLQGRLSALQVT